MNPKLDKLTPILVVEAIEPCLGFWVERLGFEKTVEVPHGETIGFCILVAEGLELMLQSRASVEDDVPAIAAGVRGSVLFLEVPDLDAVAAAVAGVEILIPERTTFYGMRELFVREPGGHVVGFAQKVEPDEVGDGG